MLRRFRVEGYKSLDGVDIRLAPLTVVFGPNAAGKSNLLDALSLLGRMVTEPNLDAAFAEHRGAPIEAFTLPPGGMPYLLESKQAAQFTFIADVHLSDAVVNDVEAEIRRAREGLDDHRPSKRRSVTERDLRYTVTIEIVTATGVLRVVDERLEALNRDGEPKQSRVPFLETMKGKGRIHLRMERQSHPTYEDLGQDRTVVSKALYTPHYPHITAFRAELERWRFYFLEPSAMRKEVALKEVEWLAHDGADLAAFYHTLKTRNAKQFEGFEKMLRQVVPSARGVEVETTKQGFLQLSVNEGETTFPARLISEGSLRVLGLLAIANPMRPASLIGYEEPENGVHPRRLSLIAKLLASAADRGSTQFVINTHSTVLPDDFADIDEAVLVNCSRRGSESSFEPFEAERSLLRGTGIAMALDDEGIEPPSLLSTRILRGDFD